MSTRVCDAPGTALETSLSRLPRMAIGLSAGSDRVGQDQSHWALLCTLLSLSLSASHVLINASRPSRSASLTTAMASLQLVVAEVPAVVISCEQVQSI